MVDNVDVTEGSGKTIATDDVGGFQHQRVKLSLGADGSAVDAVGGTGADSTGVQRVSLATDIPLPAGSAVIGAVVGKTVVADFTPTCLVSALDAADVLADTQVLAACFRANDATGVLQSITLIDKDDFGGALKIFILDVDATLGTEGSAVSITDANADNILAVIDIATSDYHDLIGSQVAQIRNLAIPIKPPSGTDDLYIAIQGGAANTNTYTASGLVLRFGILQD